MEEHERFMAEALKEAEKALALNEVPVGCVVVCQGRVIGRGHNLCERLTDPTAHAEMQAITAATHHLGGKYLHHCTLYVTLEPCTMCAGAMYWSQLSRVVWAAADPKRGFSRVQPSLLHPQTETIACVQAGPAEAMLKDFFRKLRKQPA